MDVITRKEAIERGLKHYFTGEPCKRGHVAVRHISGPCAECNRENSKKRYESGKASPPNRERIREYRREYYKKNKDRLLSYGKKWKEKNREKVAESRSRHRKKMAHLFRSYSAARYASEKSRTPEWADRDAISKVYAQAKLAEAVTGIEHHVDHIVPLQGKNVCGLHVPWNLQVLEAEENMKKGNRF